MNITFELSGNVHIARLPQRLMLANAPAIRAALLERIAAGGQRLVLDLSGVEFADSSGLSAILASVTAARRGGGDVVLLAPTPRVRALIELTRLDDVITVTTDATHAVARLANRDAA